MSRPSRLSRRISEARRSALRCASSGKPLLRKGMPQQNFPAVGEVLEPFRYPWIIEGWMRGSHYGPLMPVSVKQATPTRFDGPPRVACLGFQLADGRLIGPRDMFDDPSYDEARRDANRIADVLRMHGPFEPHRLPLDEMEYTTMPQIMKKLEGRWAKV